MADYWIKLYHEILDDPKMAVLPDRLWRRVIELFLMAGKLRKGGQLPETKQIAWMLRMSHDELSIDLQQIENTRIISRNNDGWFICNFEKRQAAASDAERKKQQRVRDQKNQYYGDDNVTDLSRNVTQITDNRLQIPDTDQKPRPNIFTLYEREIGIISPQISDELILAEEEYSAEWIDEAIKEAAHNNARKWSYVHSILKRWKTDGRKVLSSNGKGAQTIRVDFGGIVEERTI